MSREDQFNVTVDITRNIAGAAVTKTLGTFDKMSGFEVDSEETKFWPGGMAKQLSLGGKVNVGNGTISRLYDLARDHPISGWLIEGVGKARVVITKTSLDVDGNAYGNALTYTGTLKMVQLPEPDSESSDPALIELEISSASVTQNA